MNEFRLNIELGNDAMRTGKDVAEALRRVAIKIDDNVTPNEAYWISDVNGNRVGTYKLEYRENNNVASVEPVVRKKIKRQSRSQRWADAVSDAQNALTEMLANVDALDQGVANLVEVQQEYSDWKDNMPENLANSPMGEKLEEIANLDLESIADNVRGAIDDAESNLADAENVELPQGFGRD